MHLYLIRHAESANNHLYATTGGGGRHPDPPLTERGHRQARPWPATWPPGPTTRPRLALSRHARSDTTAAASP